MSRIIKAGSTDQSVELYIIDDSDGTPEIGVVYNSAGIDLKYRREGGLAISITEINLTTPALDDAHEDGGFLEIGNGIYRFDVPDAAFADGAASVVIFGTVTGMIVLPITIELAAVDVITDAVWDEVLTGATHNVSTSAGRRLRGIQEFQGYEKGAIWIDTVNGSDGTTAFENGTVENPVKTLADALTLAANLGITHFEVEPGSTITLDVAVSNKLFNGVNWTLALGGQDISNSMFVGAVISGIGVGTGKQTFLQCFMDVVTLPPNTHVLESSIAGTQTIGAAGDFFYDRCHSAIAGIAVPVFDFGSALNASNLSFRSYSGGIEIKNMGAGTGSYNMSLEGNGQLIINANCSATSLIAIRGNFVITDNAGGAVTLSDDARIDIGQINAQVEDVLKTDTVTLPGQEAPPLTPTFEEMISWLYKVLRNRKTQTSILWQLLADDEVTVDAKATVSDDGSTAVKQEIASGP